MNIFEKEILVIKRCSLSRNTLSTLSGIINRAIKKPLTLDGVEFLRRFCQHILPKRFVKIKRYGIYNHTAKRNLDLQFTPEKKPDIDAIIKQQQLPQTNVERFSRLTGVNPCLCPVCKTGRMVVIGTLPGIRSPDWSFERVLSPCC